ncbi:hypothetical protein PENSPDRAFT_688991 [Peniophora sp. CONT]|nr:hypothetical protein PENSPDRAFT_688991 [Peniophora sp. CONT]
MTEKAKERGEKGRPRTNNNRKGDPKPLAIPRRAHAGFDQSPNKRTTPTSQSARSAVPESMQRSPSPKPRAHNTRTPLASSPDKSLERRAKRLRVIREDPFQEPSHHNTRSQKTDGSTPPSSSSIQRQRRRAIRRAPPAEHSTPEPLGETSPSPAPKGKTKAPVRFASSTPLPTAPVPVGTSNAGWNDPAPTGEATSSAVGPSRLASGSPGHLSTVRPERGPVEMFAQPDLAPASASVTDSRSASATPGPEDSGAGTEQSISPPSTPSQTGGHSAEQTLSLSAVKSLLGLRKSSLEVLNEEQLPEELRVDNIRRLLGRTAAGIVDARNAGEASTRG